MLCIGVDKTNSFTFGYGIKGSGMSKGYLILDVK